MVVLIGAVGCLQDLRIRGNRSLLDLGEVSLAQLQLAIVARRLRSLQRVVRRASEYQEPWARRRNAKQLFSCCFSVRQQLRPNCMCLCMDAAPADHDDDRYNISQLQKW